MDSFRTLSALLLMTAVVVFIGYSMMPSLPTGFAFAGPFRPASHLQFFHDDTWVDDQGQRQVSQTIVDEVFRLIEGAQHFLLIDMFLYNDFQGQTPEHTRPLAAELTQRLIAQQQRFPKMTIIVITDPINTVYDGLSSPYFEALRDQGITVVISDLDLLPDSNPVYSLFWRLLIKPFGNRQVQTLPNPFGAGRVSARSWLRMINFKANHRKVLIADQGNSYVGLVTSGNPHDGSSAHRNVALRFDGPAVEDLWRSEAAILALQGVTPPVFSTPFSNVQNPTASHTIDVRILTEREIKQALLNQLDSSQLGDAIDMIMFYLADRQIISALKAALRRGAKLRLILDPNKDAFGFNKNGIPNRPVAAELAETGIPIRWCDTHGEQCHVKMILLHHKNSTSDIILGSANLTRRNLDNLNLETDVQIHGPQTSLPVQEAVKMFETYWHNTPDRQFTVAFEHYREPSRFKYWLYRFQEATGMSAF